MNNKIVCLILFFLFFLNCINLYKKNLSPKEYDFTVVKYKDSLLKVPVDSFYIKNEGTVFSSAKFPLNGFFKIFDPERSSCFSGTLKAGKKQKNGCFTKNI